MADWGITAALTAAGSTVNWTRGMGGTSPDTDNMTLDSVSVYMSSTGTGEVRVAVYQGGSLTDPNGATLVEDLGLIANGGSAGWKTATSSTNPALTKNAVTWIIAKDWGEDVNINNSSSSGDAGDFQSARGRADLTGHTDGDDPADAFPATMDNTGVSFSDFWYAMHLDYTVSGGISTVGAAQHYYRHLMGA